MTAEVLDRLHKAMTFELDDPRIPLPRRQGTPPAPASDQPLNSASVVRSDVAGDRASDTAEDEVSGTGYVGPVEPVARLAAALARVPGIGPKTALRLTYRLLRSLDGEARAIEAALAAVRNEVVLCGQCFNISIGPRCRICLDPNRDDDSLCVVEEPLDLLALERTQVFRGRYHVLHGAISPIDGILPNDLRIRELLARVADRAANGQPYREVILATNPTLEGEATALYLAERLAGKVGAVTRIARGLVTGGDLYRTDEGNLVRSVQGRRELAPEPERQKS